MELHEVCEIFPPMSEEEFDALKESIKEIGVVEPIWLYDGKVIDGKNRLRAIEELDLGIQYKTREFRDNDPGALIDFVNAKNLHRRHLSPSQLAMCAAKAKKYLTAEIKTKERERKRQAKAERQQDLLDEAERNGTEPTLANLPRSRNAREEVAKTYGISSRNVANAEKVLNESPELARKVEVGTMTVHKAKLELEGTKVASRRTFMIPIDPQVAMHLLVRYFQGEALDVLLRGLADWAGYELVPKE